MVSYESTVFLFGRELHDGGLPPSIRPRIGAFDANICIHDKL